MGEAASLNLQLQYLELTRKMVRRGLLRARLLSKDAMAELLVASMLDGVLAHNDQNPGYDLVTPDGKKVQVKVRCRSSTNQPGKVEFRPDADFEVLAVVELDRGASTVLRAGLLKAADAHAAVTGSLDKQGRVKVQVQHFFRHAAVEVLTAEAQPYALARIHRFALIDDGLPNEQMPPYLGR